jgi:uncharacterized membrane protein YedE/YeeE
MSEIQKLVVVGALGALFLAMFLGGLHDLIVRLTDKQLGAGFLERFTSIEQTSKRQVFWRVLVIGSLLFVVLIVLVLSVA